MTHERSSRATFSLDLIARAAAAAAKLLLPLEAPVPTANSADEVQLRQLRSRTCLRVALGSLPVGSQLAVAPRHAMAQSVRRRKRMRRVLLPWSQPWRGRHRRGPRRRQGRYDDDDDEPDADGLFDAETGVRRARRSPVFSIDFGNVCLDGLRAEPDSHTTRQTHGSHIRRRAVGQTSG